MALALTAGSIGIAILVLLAALHIYWAAGGKSGKTAAIPEVKGAPLFRPGPMGTLAVALALLAVAGLLALRIGDAAPASLRIFVKAGTWIAALIFAVRAIGDFRYVGFFKSVRGTRFARQDSLFYSPLCVLLAGLIALTALG
jgi:hypothetical protein